MLNLLLNNIMASKAAAQMWQVLTAQIRHNALLITMVIALALFILSWSLSRRNRELLQMASIDEVTGLANSKTFFEIYNQNSTGRAYQSGKVFMFDIDNFKEVNDTYGHIEGNAVLARISIEAQKAVGINGIVARWGGDEFVGVVYGNSEQTEAILRKFVDDVSKIKDCECKSLTISLGAVEITANTYIDMLVNEADKIMYCVKENGKNGAAFFK